MERALITELVNWKEKPNRKPLVLKGVRQCGETYLLKEFGKRYYKNVAYFNFEETSALNTVFEKDYDVKRIVFALGLSSTVPNGTRVSFSHTRLRILPNTAKVALCERVVEML